jgi:hypothetical protein
MPFRSEKQRRYLWAKHPEIARKWADKYKTNKDLPMYVNSEERKSADTEKRALEKLYTTSLTALKNMGKTVQNRPFAGVFMKDAGLSTQKVELPASEKPMAAGETEAKMHATPNECDGDENAAKSLMGKIAAVISQRILKEVEERKALEEARKAQYIPQNVNLRSYPVNSGPQIPPPMGMTPPPQQPAQPQPQQQAQNTTAPVGGGSSPMANPINSFGALSMDGNINGNAAFGTKNSPDSSKMAAAITKWAAASPTTPCSCGCGDTVATCKCSADCKCRKPGGSCYKAEKKAGSPAWQRAAGKNDEGGLNAKGRASYNKATGGNLKAPVTESNPKGKRAKRQNSFCSRMCGMKKHETGSKTKKDPDSRINKALRKWNCKCGSEKVAASPFGGQPMINAMLRQNKTDQTVNRAASLLSPAVLNALGKRIGLGVGPALSFGASLGHTGVGHGLTAQQKMLQQFQQSQAPK